MFMMRKKGRKILCRKTRVVHDGFKVSSIIQLRPYQLQAAMARDGVTVNRSVASLSNKGLAFLARVWEETMNQRQAA